MRSFAFAAVLAVAGALSAQAADVVRLGVLTDMTGPLSGTLGEGSVEGARMAVEDFGGTLLGKKLEVVSGDHQNKADVGAAIARRWIDTNDVPVVLDLGNSAVAIAVQNLVKEKDRISIATGAASGELTNKYCSPNSMHWGYDSYQFTKASTAEIVKNGGNTWFFITMDYAFGHAVENDSRAVVEAAGGKVLGAARAPFGTADFSSYLLQAQSSGAKVIAFASTSADLQNALKQAAEFNLFSDGKTMSAAPILLLADIPAIGLKAAQGTLVSTVFYWDTDEGTRKFSERFMKKMGKAPTEAHAMTYSATLHYLKAVKAAGTLDAQPVLAKMRETPIEDFASHGARIREDGRVIRNVHLARVKKPEQSKGPWDYFELLNVIKGEDAFRPVSQSVCPLLKKG